MPSENEAWVTFAENDSAAKSSLLLLRSLRRVGTNRQIILVVRHTLSQELWGPLEQSFDAVYPILPVSDDFQVDSTIFAVSLVAYKKLVMLDPCSLVLENADELFCMQGFLKGKNEKNGTLVLEPDFKTFMTLVQQLKNNCDTNGKVLQLLKSNLDEIYDFHVDTTTTKLSQEELLIISPKIVHLKNVETFLAQNGHLAIFLHTIWNLSKELGQEVDEFVGGGGLGNVNEAIQWKRYENEPIAVVGMSCRMPESNNVEEYWKLLVEGKCAVRDLPEGRWTKEQSCYVNEEHRKVQAGFFSCPVDEFDAKFFGMSPAESEFTDPQQRLLLEVTWEALEDAAINPKSLYGTQVGVFAGAWTLDYKEHLLEIGMRKGFCGFRAFMGNSYGTMGARLSHYLGITGLNICPESGCSSSSVAVGLGVQSLRKGEVNMALACGVNLLVAPFSKSAFSGLLSDDYRCQVFDEGANGFARAEGCGTLVLKRVSDAIKDGDRIHALIRGFGMSQEGKSKSMGTPTVDGEALAMQLALDDAHILPEQVQVVEAHGTGTSVGDPLEVLAITKVYSTPQRKDPLIITAGKANIGHTESTSGIAGIIKTILEFKHQTIPPQILIKTLNPHINLENIPAIITQTLKPWKSSFGPRIAGVSSFGITGTDTHLILQETPPYPGLDSKCGVLKSPPQNLLTISAKNNEALEDFIQLYKTYFEQHKEMSLDSVAFTANTGRAHFSHRLSISGKSCADILDKLEKRLFDIGETAATDKPPTLTFLFTGQGSQFHKMGNVLYNTSPIFKVNFDLCENILKSLYGLQIKDALWGEDKTKLHQSLHSQSAIFIIEYCLVKVWESWGIIPTAVVGHSLGEFAAATTAGIISLEDALRLLGARCRLIDGLPKGKMIAVKCNQDQAEALVIEFLEQKNKDYWLDTAAVNSADQTTLSGPEEVVQGFSYFCDKKNIKSHVLDATHAFHSRAMDPILAEYYLVAKSIIYHKPKMMFISGVEGKELRELDANYWIRHTREGVQFLKAASTCFADQESPPIFLEVGPHPVLSALVYANVPSSVQNVKCFPSVRKPAINNKDKNVIVESPEWQTMLDTLGKLHVNGVSINFKEFHRYHPKEKVQLPFYPFQRKQFWMPMLNFVVSKKQFHPLLGSKLELPKSPADLQETQATKQNRFQNLVTIRSHAYIGEHKVGRHALMPASGFIELFLAAASTSSAQEFPIILENVVIKSPFLVDEVIPRELHTVLTLYAENDKTTTAKMIAFGRKADAKPNTPWNTHSETTANMTLSQSQIEAEQLPLENLGAVQDRIFAEEPIDFEIYKQMAAQGYNFGKLFQSLGTTWILGRERLTKVHFPSDLNDERDMAHPILIDAMIQALLLSKLEKLNGLYLPVSVKKFVLLDTSFSPKSETHSEYDSFFVHVKDISSSDKSQQIAVLYKSCGTPIAAMYGLEVVKILLPVLEKTLEAAKKEKAVPPLFQENWIRSNLFSSFQMDFPLIDCKELKSIVDSECIDKKLDLETYELTDECMSGSIMLAIIELRYIPPPLGSWIKVEDLMEDLNITKDLLLPMRRYLEILAEDGYFHQSSQDTYQFQLVQNFPSKKKLEFIQQKTYAELVRRKSTDTHFHFYMKKLSLYLSGKQSILDHLFPEDENSGESISANKMYSETQICNRNIKSIYSVLPYILSKRGLGGVVRILEVGAGTGSATTTSLQVLSESGVKYSYTFTDISNAFFYKARETFSSYSNNMQYKVLNIEEDPKAQGFAPNQFDIVIAANVLHATRNLTETCRNIRLLMKNYGVVIIAETLKPQRTVDLTFGMLPGYWRQTDLDIRPRHCLIDGNTWVKVLQNTGFTEKNLVLENNAGRTGIIIGQAGGTQIQYVIPDPEESAAKNIKNTWIVFSNPSAFSQALKSRLALVGSSLVEVEHDPGELKMVGNKCKINWDSKFQINMLWEAFRQKSILEDVEGLIFAVTEQFEEECEQQASFYIRSFLHFIQCILQEWPSGKFPKVIVITKGAVTFGDQTPTCPAISPIRGIYKTFLSENRSAVGKYIDICPDEQFEENSASQVISELWNDDPQQLLVYRGGIRHIYKIIPCPNNRPNLPYPPLDLETSFTAKRFHVVIPKTHSMADIKFETHNIKPVLDPFQVEVEVKASALNFRDVLSVLKPIPQFDEINAVGVDICGTIVAVGSGVTKRKVGDAVLGCNYKNMAMPSHVVMHESATVMLPQRMTFAEGATLPTVFVTAYHCLVTVGQLKAGETILIHTASGGVGLCAVQIAKDIGAKIVATAGSRRKRAYLKFVGIKNVFNSRDLSFGEGIMKATGGLGVNMVLNSLTGSGFKETSLECCAPNARFVEMSKLNIWSVEEVKKLRKDVKYSIEDLSSADPTTMFFLFGELEKYLKHPTHPLKPLPYTRFDAVDIRSALNYLEKAKQIGKVVCVLPEPATKEMSKVEMKLFNNRSTYLVTGGCGGIGFEVMKWLCVNGASTVVICGRRVPSPENMKQIEALNKLGKNILVMQGDIGDKNRCKEILDWIKKELPPLRGIMHSAGTLSDAIIPNQTVEKFEITFNPKIRGGWNLHKLTLDLQLEHFVMFSSGVALVGISGQSNHAACNAFLDSLALYRRSLGLAGSTVNWGQWGEVGVAAGKSILVFYPFSTIEGLNALEVSLRVNAEQLSPLDFDVAGLKMLFPWVEHMMDMLSLAKDGNATGKGEVISSDAFWGELNAAPENERFSVIKSYLKRIVTNLLRMDEALEDDQNFQDLGMDSLMMIELKNQLQSMLGSEITLSGAEMADCKTLGLTTQKIFDIIYSKNLDSNVLRNELIVQDSKLWDTVDISNSSPPHPIEQVHIIFMTGATGTFGPFVLQQLTNRPQITKVICLVRQGKLNSAKARLVNRLEYLELLNRTDMNKVTVIEGDLTKDHFGLNESMYNTLASQAEAVIHCGVYTSHLDTYGKGASTKTGTKAVNVDGTQRVLEFASHTLVKHVYNASTLLGAWYKTSSLADMQGFHSSWPEDNDANDAPNFGYGISKFIADRLISQAVKKGIPCKSFRFSKINGEKETGRQEVENNHFFIKFIYFVQKGIMPDIDIPLQVFPVDTAAQVSLSLFFNPQVPSELFNVLNPHHHYESEIGELTHEYGPLLRITERLGEVVDQLSELSQEPENLLPNFLRLLNNLSKQEDIDLEPIMGLLSEMVVEDPKTFLNNPSLLLKDQKVRTFLKENYGYPMRLVPFDEFLAQLHKDGERAQLYKWIEFYSRDDSVYRVAALSSFTGQFDKYKLDPVAFLRKSCEKIVKYIPDYYSLVPDSLDVVKLDFEFAIGNALQVFKRTGGVSPGGGTIL